MSERTYKIDLKPIHGNGNMKDYYLIVDGKPSGTLTFLPMGNEFILRTTDTHGVMHSMQWNCITICGEDLDPETMSKVKELTSNYRLEVALMLKHLWNRIDNTVNVVDRNEEPKEKDLKTKLLEIVKRKPEGDDNCPDDDEGESDDDKGDDDEGRDQAA